MKKRREQNFVKQKKKKKLKWEIFSRHLGSLNGRVGSKFRIHANIK